MSSQEWYFRQLIEVTNPYQSTRYIVRVDGETLLGKRGKERTFELRESAAQAGRREARRRWLHMPDEQRYEQRPLSLALEFQAESYVAHAPHGKYVIMVNYKGRPRTTTATYTETEFLPYFHPRQPVEGQPRCEFLEREHGRCTSYEAAIECCMRHAREHLTAAAPTAPEAEA